MVSLVTCISSFFVCCLSFGSFAQFTFERLLQSTGKTFYIMITQGIGAVINIILDPIFIFGLFGVPGMGVRGAAVATVIGQITAGLLAFLIVRSGHLPSGSNKKVSLQKARAAGTPHNWPPSGQCRCRPFC